MSSDDCTVRSCAWSLGADGWFHSKQRLAITLYTLTKKILFLIRNNIRYSHSYNNNNNINNRNKSDIGDGGLRT